MHIKQKREHLDQQADRLKVVKYNPCNRPMDAGDALDGSTGLITTAAIVDSLLPFLPEPYSLAALINIQSFTRKSIVDKCE
jgi:hypothetical protein